MFHLTQIFPDCADFDQKNLQRHVRESLGELKTGTSNEGNGKATLQNGDVLKRLKLTNSYASMVMVAKREAIVSAACDPSSGDSIASESGWSNKTDVGPARIAFKRPGNPKAHLAEEFKSSAAAWEEHLKRKDVQLSYPT